MISGLCHDVTRHLLLVVSRGVVASAVLFLAAYSGAVAAVLFAKAFSGSDPAWLFVACGLAFVLRIEGWRQFVIDRLSDECLRWILGTTHERQ